MATNSGVLVQALIDGGISAAAARLIANALANASTPQFSQARDVSDQTPIGPLRMIGRDERLYQFTNLDYSSEDPYEQRLRSNPGQYAGRDLDHPYKDAQPVLPVPPLSKPRVAGGAYIRVEDSVQDGAPVATVGLHLSQTAGTHLRLNKATNSLDAVPLAFASPQGLVTAEASEGSSATTIELQVRSLSPVTVVQADGTSVGLSAWPNTAVSPTTVFTPWAQTNVMSKTSAAGLLSAIGAPAYSTGTWTPAFACSTTNPTATYSAVTFGSYTKVGQLVFVSGRAALSALANAGSGFLTISGLPFAATAGAPGYHSGTVAFKGGWTTQGPTNVYTEPSSTSLVLSYHTATGLGLLTNANLSASTDVFFSVAYTTSA